MGRIPNEIMLPVTIVMLIVFSLWLWQFVEVRGGLAELKGKALEECYYWNCTVTPFGGLDCNPSPLPRAKLIEEIGGVKIEGLGD
jgi:hypothetical protein